MGLSLIAANADAETSIGRLHEHAASMNLQMVTLRGVVPQQPPEAGTGRNLRRIVIRS
jgi:hypothetical protein